MTPGIGIAQQLNHINWRMHHLAKVRNLRKVAFPIFTMKRGKIWQVPEVGLREIVASSSSFSEVIRRIGLTVCGGNLESLQKRIVRLNLDISHFTPKHQKTIPQNKIPLQEILVAHSTYKRIHLRDRLIQNHLLKYECAICGLGPEWEGKELVLTLDHINGVKDDHRLENLRFLCPNCHSQTETFSGKNANKSKRKRG